MLPVWTTNTELIEVLAALILATVQFFGRSQIAAMVNQRILRHPQRSQILTYLHIERIGIILSTRVVQIRLSRTPPKAV